jgi:hypothetical protein
MTTRRITLTTAEVIMRSTETAVTFLALFCSNCFFSCFFVYNTARHHGRREFRATLPMPDDWGHLSR